MDVLKRLMLRIGKAEPVNMDGVFESDEIYVTAVLKGRSKSPHQALWQGPQEARAVSVELGQAFDLHPSGEAVEEDMFPSATWRPKSEEDHRRRVSEGSTVYTDFFKAYLGLSKAGYRHEAVNHSGW